MQAWGLIVLLVSKAAGHINVDSSADEDKSGVLRSQRALAEIAEMIRTSHLMHNGLINIYPKMFPKSVDHDDISYGNKIGLLSGDYLLANSFYELSMLKNQNVSRYMLWIKKMFTMTFCLKPWTLFSDHNTKKLDEKTDPNTSKIVDTGYSHFTANYNIISLIIIFTTQQIHNIIISNTSIKLSKNTLTGTLTYLP